MSPEVGLARAKNRGSSGDTKLTLSYLKKLDEDHEEMMKNEELPVLMLDAEKDPQTLAMEAADWIKETFF